MNCCGRHVVRHMKTIQLRFLCSFYQTMKSRKSFRQCFINRFIFISSIIIFVCHVQLKYVSSNSNLER